MGDYTLKFTCASSETWSPGVYYTDVSDYIEFLASLPTVLTAIRMGDGMRLDVNKGLYGMGSLLSMQFNNEITTIA